MGGDRKSAGVGIGIAALIGFVLAVVAIATVAWIYVHPSPNQNELPIHIGLWQTCSGGFCNSGDRSVFQTGFWAKIDVENENREAANHLAVQILSILSAVIQLIASICHLVKEIAQAHRIIYAIATLFSAAAALMLAAMGLFTSIYAPLPEGSVFGYSYILGWLSFCVSLVIAVVSVYHAVLESRKLKHVVT